MARSISLKPSRALAEFRLLPRLSTPETTPAVISLKTPFTAAPKGGTALELNIPFVAAAMQSVSGAEMGIALAKQGGAAVIFCSQTAASQAEMIQRIKRHKAGFVEPRTVSPKTTIQEVWDLARRVGFSTFPVVDERSVLLGLITRYDYDVKRHGALPVTERMIPASKLEVGVNLTDLKEANARLLEGHHAVVPVVDGQGRLQSLVFKKDIHNHLDNPLEVTDARKRLLAVAAINTHDHEERVPALVEAGVDALVIDSSDGFSTFQRDALSWLGRRYPQMPVVGGNIVTAAGFDYLVAAGAKAIKVGMGGGTICITQEQKGTGRGLATALMDVCEARDRYLAKTGEYIPVIADGGVVTAKDATIALALGADSVMMGRYFARMDESPTEKVLIKNRVMKPYWGEGSARAREWKAARYHQSMFVEGVEGFVEYAGKLADNLPETLAMMKSSLSSCGVANIAELHREAELEIVSALSIREGKAHDIYIPSGNEGDASRWDE